MALRYHEGKRAGVEAITVSSTLRFSKTTLETLQLDDDSSGPWKHNWHKIVRYEEFAHHLVSLRRAIKRGYADHRYVSHHSHSSIGFVSSLEHPAPVSYANHPPPSSQQHTPLPPNLDHVLATLMRAKEATCPSPVHRTTQSHRSPSQP